MGEEKLLYATQRTATWRTGFLMAVCVAALTLATAGPLAQQIGPVSVLVWFFSSFIGIWQVIIYSELAGMYPTATGGMTMCMGDAFDRFGKWPSIISQWSYWYAWIPVQGIMPMLMADYLNQILGTSFNPYLVGLLVLLFLYAINYMGLQISEKAQAVVVALSLFPMLIILLVGIGKGLLVFDNFLPFRPYGEWGDVKNLAGSWLSLVSWIGIGSAFYIAGWGTYAFETITVYVGEYKDPVKDTFKAAWTSGTAVTIMNTLIAVSLIGVLGVKGFAENPDYPFFKLSEAVLGPVGGRVAMFVIFTGLLSMANTSFNGTARILFGMSAEGSLPRSWAKLSPRGFPYIAAIFNIAFALFLMSFGAPVMIICASNLAYMICIFMPLFAFCILRKKRPDHPRPFRLPDWFVTLSWILGWFNVILILPAALFYGAGAMITGTVITLLCIPLYFYRQWRDKNRKVGSAG